jgi:hypothetical protein
MLHSKVSMKHHRVRMKHHRVAMKPRGVRVKHGDMGMKHHKIAVKHRNVRIIPLCRESVCNGFCMISISVVRAKVRHGGIRTINRDTGTPTTSADENAKL